jgi:hypothetical protein
MEKTMDLTALWSALGAGFGAAAGVVAKSLWDRYAGWQSEVPFEAWKLRSHQLERRLSEFYWPLYARLLRDDIVWKKVFYELRPRHDRERPAWAQALSEDSRRKLSQEIEAKVLLPNHVDAASIWPLRSRTCRRVSSPSTSRTRRAALCQKPPFIGS